MIKDTIEIVYYDEDADSIKQMIAESLVILPGCPVQKLISLVSRLYGGNYSVLVWELELFVELPGSQICFTVEQGVRVATVLSVVRKFLKDADIDLVSKFYYEATSAYKNESNRRYAISVPANANN